MNLINDVYFIVSLCRSVGNFFSDLTNVVYTIVGCSIDLDHIHGSSGLDCLAHGTFITWAAIDRMLAVHRFRQNLRHSSFTGSSGSAEQIRMTDAIMFDLIGQSCHYMILTLDIVKIVWSEFSVKGSITHEQTPILSSQPPRKRFPRRYFSELLLY